ncbi:MAG: discoidin domain-containing protein [Marinilabiliaceae bacterium]|jgi:photosystem II stability/assembly factor-like uncharacterized protein|nr:discoidin domain-containing protein [Marinilabiliaceae bacterium]
MKIISRSFYFSTALLFLFMASYGQGHTSYDEISPLLKSYKPAYSTDLPEWAKMLYKYPVNYNDIRTAYDRYISIRGEEKNAVSKYYKTWVRELSPYVQPDGSIVMPDLDKIRFKLRESQLAAVTRTERKESPAWTFLGPKETYWLNSDNNPVAPLSCPWQANVYSFDVSASNNNILYCGTETGIANKSTDKGTTWSQTGLYYPFGGGITAVAIDPLNPDIVYLSAGTQVHKTTDGGNTWNPLLSPSGEFHSVRLKIYGNYSDTVYAAANEGVRISYDAGLTWTAPWNLRSWDLEIKPDDPSRVYSITENASGYFEVIESIDGGATFSKISSFPAISNSSGALLAVTGNDPNLLFVLMLSTGNTPLLYRGTLSESTWTWQHLASGNTSSLEMNNGQGYFDLVLEVAPYDKNIVFAGTTTLYKSVNGGSSFTPVGGYHGDFAIHPDIQDMKLLSNGETWVSTDGGMILTTDNFTSTNNYYARINGLIGSDMWGFDQAWNEDIVVGGRYHNGNTAISDMYGSKALRMGGAESPTGWVLKGKSRHVAFNDLGSGWILPETAEAEPEGRFIFSKYPNMDEYGGRRGNLLHHPNYYGVLMLGEGQGFWKSEDMGFTYDLLHSFPDRVRYMQISYSNPEVIYADIVGYGLYKSEDGGKTWTLKPALTNGSYGTAYWKGKLFFDISPYDSEHIYACLQNGTWSTDTGKVFESTDGGDTWNDISGSLSEYTKNIVVQPGSDRKDLVYLFTNSKEGSVAKVFYRREGMSDWAEYDSGYPSGMKVNLALPFFRDSKIRVGGSAGVWEAPLADPDFIPIINPWVERPNFNCFLDTLHFDDHSILNHAGSAWNWTISPEPAYISDTDTRNPKVVLGEPGSYTVTLKVTKNGQEYSRTIENMVSATTCPSVDDCSNPADIPKDNWSLIYTDSQEDDGPASNAFDDDVNTIWHTEWKYTSPTHPHEIQIDLGAAYFISKISCLPRQYGVNGRIKDYEIYLTNDKNNWGSYVKKGTFENTYGPQIVKLNAISGRYLRLRALSEQNDNIWTSLAEIDLVGCYDKSVGINDLKINELSAFPVPSTGIVNITLPHDGFSKYNYSIYSINAYLVDSGTINGSGTTYSMDISDLKQGYYMLILTTDSGSRYRIKLIKE